MHITYLKFGAKYYHCVYRYHPISIVTVNDYDILSACLFLEGKCSMLVSFSKFINPI